MVKFLLLTCALGLSTPCQSGAAQQRGALSTAEAAERAKQEMEARLSNLPDAYARAFVESTDGVPLLVFRPDTESLYFLIPFQKNDETTLVVRLDARNGSFKEAAPMGT